MISGAAWIPCYDTGADTFTVEPADRQHRGTAVTLKLKEEALEFLEEHRLREVVRLTPPDRLLIETDAPFLAPSPHRGKRNEPAFVVHTARQLAEAHGEPLERIAQALRAEGIEVWLDESALAGGEAWDASIRRQIREEINKVVGKNYALDVAVSDIRLIEQ